MKVCTCEIENGRYRAVVVMKNAKNELLRPRQEIKIKVVRHGGATAEPINIKPLTVVPLVD